jgi:GTP cyclohydrolase I
MEYPINSPEWHFQQILLQLGQDVKREGLLETPKRYIKFLKEFIEPKEFSCTTFENEGIDEMIIVTNIPFYSLCEHHTAPFFGTASIAYIPNKKIVGLSKIPRILNKYANNFQNQERITTQVAEEIQEKLNPLGVAVALKAKHLCMCMRGVKSHETFTITNKFIGTFKDNHSARSEFLKSI